MAHVTFGISEYEPILDQLIRHVETIKGMTIYHSPQTANMLIRFELSEFDPYFVHEDF